MSKIDPIGEPMLGRDVQVGDRLFRTNTATGHVQLSGQITLFTTPRLPANAENAENVPVIGTRIAWAGQTCLGPIEPDELFMVERRHVAAVA